MSNFESVFCDTWTANLYAVKKEKNTDKWYKFDFIEDCFILYPQAKQICDEAIQNNKMFEIKSNTDEEIEAAERFCFYGRLFYNLLSDFENDEIHAYGPTFLKILHKAAKRADKLELKPIAKRYYEECVAQIGIGKERSIYDALIRLTK